MNYWVITDTHLGHDKMHKEGYRPEGFEDIILKNLRHCVKLGDVLIHLGDVCFYRNKYWHSIIQEVCIGKRWLLRGNHDKKSVGWYLSHGWDMVANSLTLDIFGKRITFSHCPILDVSGCDMNIHGHHHNTKHHHEDITTEKHQLVFIEHTYTPINLRRIVEMRRN